MKRRSTTLGVHTVCLKLKNFLRQSRKKCKQIFFFKMILFELFDVVDLTVRTKWMQNENWREYESGYRPMATVWLVVYELIIARLLKRWCALSNERVEWREGERRKEFDRSMRSLAIHINVCVYLYCICQVFEKELQHSMLWLAHLPLWIVTIYPLHTERAYTRRNDGYHKFFALVCPHARILIAPILILHVVDLVIKQIHWNIDHIYCEHRKSLNFLRDGQLFFFHWRSQATYFFVVKNLNLSWTC